jgi:hypothetical protein
MVTGCGYECGCESEEVHEAARERSMREFLRDPGPPPASMSPESIERAWEQIVKARRETPIECMRHDPRGYGVGALCTCKDLP